MKLFKVTCEPIPPQYRNPFNHHMTAESFGCEVTIRTWEFEAQDEEECRRLFREAQAMGHSNVSGYQIRSIVEIDRLQRAEKGERDE